MILRREFLVGAAAAAVLGQERVGKVRHILPAANHERFLIKTSFWEALEAAPVLRVGNRKIGGIRGDTEGRFWRFDVEGLAAGTSYELQLREAGGKALNEPWQLKTFPPPGAGVDKFRLLIYTCAGGHDAMKQEGTDLPYWVSIPARRKIFANALRMAPDAAIAIGDHVYWDLRYGRGTGRLPIGDQPWARAIMGAAFDRDLPVMGTPNELLLQRAVDRQIAELYGTLFQSVPVHFIQDDHDYFENDEAIAAGISFPPDDFMMRLARGTQHLYFPEHLPDAWRPAGLAGASAPDRSRGVGECYGTLRVGNLVEMLLYDCRRFQTLRGPHATLVPENVEAWLQRRMATSEAAHVVNVPSMPIAWSAGKWGEWYPDVLDDAGNLGIAKEKYFWQTGWRAQHDRLLEACSAMKKIPVFMSGDLHALGHGEIARNGKMDLRANPVHSILTGPVSTGPRGWPSSARGTPPLTASGLEVKATLDPLEDNGFTIVDFTREAMEVKMYSWKIGRPQADLDTMKLRHSFRMERRV